jgi:quinol monooxygenase YgiN
MYQSAVDPSEVDAVHRLFNDDVRPVFENAEGCLAIDLIVKVGQNAGGLVEGCALSRWTSLEALEAALATREVEEALVRVRGLLRQEPVTKTYQVLD